MFFEKLKKKKKKKLHLSIVHWFAHTNSSWLSVFSLICAHNLTLSLQKQCIKISFNKILNAPYPMS
jgi:hypothetical protein